jgi:putative DNA primase/helicase
MVAPALQGDGMIADPATQAVFDKFADGPPRWESTGPRMVSTRADQITPSRPQWMWDRWLTAGALHLLVGRQGGGKSTFAAWLTAQITTGRPYPDDPTCREPENVATLSLEEADDRLVARLHAAGADVTKVEVLSDVEDVDDEGRPYRRPWRLPKDCSVIETFIRDARVRLLVVDGLGYSITGDSHNYAVIGSALSALSGVAERTGCAILGLTHPPKGASDPVTAAIGSTAWTAIPRVVWVLGTDPQDETEQRRVARVSKTNYRPPDNGLGFAIGNDEAYECGYVTGLGMSAVSAEDLVAARPNDGERTEREEARDLIKSILSTGPMDTSEVLKTTRAAGVSEMTVKRARRDLGVISTPRKDPATGKLLGWSLELPDHKITAPDHRSGPVGQPLIDPVDPLVMTRTYIESRGPEDPQDKSGTLVALIDGPPPPDDALFFDGEDES